MTALRHLIALVAVILMTAAFGPRALALSEILSAPDAHRLQASGTLLLVDIRSPQEWARTGIAKGAETITVHQRGFAQALLQAVGGDRNRAIAIICATGGRTAIARRYLERMGFTAVADVSEGMLGSSSGPGWIRRGLPVVPYPGN